MFPILIDLYKIGKSILTKAVFLLLDFIALLVSGIGINKTLSPTLAFLPFEAVPWHFLFGAVALVLLGIHFGLHWNWIKGTVLGKAKGLNRNSKPLAAKDIFNYTVSMLSIFVLFASLTAIIEKLVVKVCSRKRLGIGLCENAVKHRKS